MGACAAVRDPHAELVAAATATEAASNSEVAGGDRSQRVLAGLVPIG